MKMKSEAYLAWIKNPMPWEYAPKKLGNSWHTAIGSSRLLTWMKPGIVKFEIGNGADATQTIKPMDLALKEINSSSEGRLSMLKAIMGPLSAMQKKNGGRDQFLSKRPELDG